jgi:hypothetical protein
VCHKAKSPTESGLKAVELETGLLAAEAAKLFVVFDAYWLALLAIRQSRGNEAPQRDRTH